MEIPAENPIPDLLRFIEKWVVDLSSPHRVPSSEIPSFIPAPLKAVYELAGNYPIPYRDQWRAPRWQTGLFGRQDQLLPLDQLKIIDGRFRFIHENQGVWSCETQAGADDPPVYSDCWTPEYTDGDFREVCPSLSHFMTTYCLQELVFGSKNLFSTECEEDSEIELRHQLVKGDLKDLWLNGIYAYPMPSHSFYIYEAVIVMATQQTLWVAYNDDRSAADVNTTKLLGIH